MAKHDSDILSVLPTPSSPTRWMTTPDVRKRLEENGIAIAHTKTVQRRLEALEQIAAWQRGAVQYGDDRLFVRRMRAAIDPRSLAPCRTLRSVMRAGFATDARARLGGHCANPTLRTHETLIQRSQFCKFAHGHCTRRAVLAYPSGHSCLAGMNDAGILRVHSDISCPATQRITRRTGARCASMHQDIKCPEVTSC
jgi:hypothetical protein